jgi:hypothetical protein
MHQLTEADRQKRNRGPNPGAAIVTAIKKRKHCNIRCKIFEICPMMPLSLSVANKDSSCLLNKGGNIMIRRFLNLMAQGEDGILNEIRHVLYSYGQDIEVAPAQVKREYAQLLMSLHKQLYVDSKRELEARPQLTVVINEMGEGGKPREIIPILDVSPIGSERTNRKAYAAIAELEKEDPESLFSNPKLVEDLMSNVPVFPMHHLSAEERNTELGPDGKWRRKSVPEQDSRAETDEPGGTEAASKELAGAPESPSDRA